MNRPSKTNEPDNGEKAYEYAVFLLSLHLRTAGELRQKMEQRGYRPDIIEQVLDRLHAQKYLDDGRYAEIFLDNLKQYRSFGYFGIKKKFLQKRLPPELADRVLAEGLSVEDEIKIARRLLKKEGYEAAGPQPDGEISYRVFGADAQADAEKQKMARRLKSRGFRSEVIARVLY